MSGEKYPAKLVEKATFAINRIKAEEARGCWIPEGIDPGGECADADCYCVREGEKLAKAVLDAIPYAAMREALEPFAKVANGFDGYKGDDWLTKDTCFGVTIGALRNARAALRAADGEET